MFNSQKIINTMYLHVGLSLGVIMKWSTKTFHMHYYMLTSVTLQMTHYVSGTKYNRKKIVADKTVYVKLNEQCPSVTSVC